MTDEERYKQYKMNLYQFHKEKLKILFDEAKVDAEKIVLGGHTENLDSLFLEFFTMGYLQKETDMRKN